MPRIEDVIGGNGLPQRTTKTCANCQERRICTLSIVTGPGGAGQNTLLVSRYHPVWLCKVCRQRGLRTDDHPQVIAAATTAAAIGAERRQVRDGLEQLFCAARRVNGPIEES